MLHGIHDILLAVAFPKDGIHHLWQIIGMIGGSRRSELSIMQLRSSHRESNGSQRCQEQPFNAVTSYSYAQAGSSMPGILAARLPGLSCPNSPLSEHTSTHKIRWKGVAAEGFSSLVHKLKLLIQTCC